MTKYSSEADRPVLKDEIGVTPEMIEAGARELLRYDRDYESRHDAVMRIFLAMLSLRRS